MSNDAIGCIRDAISHAVTTRNPVAIQGGDSNAGCGNAAAGSCLNTAAVCGVIHYDREEQFVAAHAGTPLTEIRKLLEDNGQMLAFEPQDNSGLFGGTNTARSTIGGIIATNTSGSRRVASGAACDHLLGFEAINGSGQLFKAGGRVVKNVTGFELNRLLAGSWGTLAVLTTLTIRTVARPETSKSIVLRGLDSSDALRVMNYALASNAIITAAAYVPASSMPDHVAMTALRVEGFAVAVDDRINMLYRKSDDAMKHLLQNWLVYCGSEESTLWQQLGVAAMLGKFAEQDDACCWRISVPSGKLLSLAAHLESAGGHWQCDWGGALVWAVLPANWCLASGNFHSIIKSLEGHARLIRAPEQWRSHIQGFSPLPLEIVHMSMRIKHAFDPHGIFCTRGLFTCGNEP